jgi:Ca2+-binding RTX toxin-like protein
VQGQVGTLRFAPGETTKVVQALVLNDLVAEQTEGFWLDLSGAVNAVIPQARTAATIFDDDNPASPIFSYGLSNDLYNVTSALDRIVESVNGGMDTVRSSVSYVLPDNVENLVLTGVGALNATGNGGNNVLRGNRANNTLDGQGGVDTAVFSGPSASYTIAGTTVSRSVSSAAEGNDTLFNVERLQFADTILASDTAPGGNTYNAYAMINAAFDRAPSTQELSLWTSQLDRLGNTRDLAQAMITHYAPGVPNDALVAYLWSTIVEVPITAEALASFVGLLTNGTFTQASLLEFVSQLPFNTDEIIGIVGQTLPLDPGYFPAPALQ